MAAACARAILDQAHPSFELLVLDQSPDDELLPMAAAKAGIDYDSLTERILESALRRAKAARG